MCGRIFDVAVVPTQRAPQQFVVWDIFWLLLTGCIFWIMNGGGPGALVLVTLKLGIVMFCLV